MPAIRALELLGKHLGMFTGRAPGDDSLAHLNTDEALAREEERLLWIIEGGKREAK